MGEMIKGGYGGGIPVVAFWTASVGEAIGHVETLPLPVSIPVKTESDGRIAASMMIPANTVLKPGEVYSTPRSFLLCTLEIITSLYASGRACSQKKDGTY